MVQRQVERASDAGTVAGSHAYSAAGLYVLTLTVTDNAGASAAASYQYVVSQRPPVRWQSLLRRHVT